VSAIAGVESFWRSRGHVPIVNDGKELWSWYRNEVYGDPERTVVLVGRSRQMCGFWTDGFRERFPDHKLVQLSVAGASVLPVLRNLAQDEEFSGIVLCSIMANDLSAPEDQEHPYLDYYVSQGKESLLHHWDYGTRHHLNNLVALNSRTSLRSAWRQLYEKNSLPEPVLDKTRIDRAKYYQYWGLPEAELNKLREERLAHNKVKKPRHASSWLRLAERIEPHVLSIQERGGRVVFLRYPTTGEHDRRYEIKYPKAQIWDEFAKSTSAETIHFKDVPEMCKFECPDLSHLDIRDAPAFTSILLDELVRRSVLTGDRPAPAGSNTSLAGSNSNPGHVAASL
jgi:hypothetical protein